MKPAAARLAPHILVLGDSITWGQGLQPAEKFPELVLQRLSPGASPKQYITRVAHSGAVIGEKPATHTAAATLDGEIPAGTPTVWQQLYDPRITRPHYDLIIISACINDVQVKTLLDPLSPNLSKRVRDDCGRRLTALLSGVRVRFLRGAPKTRVIVMGYYPILSMKSLTSARSPNEFQMLEAFLRATAHPLTAKKGPDLTRLLIVQRAQQFNALSDASISGSVIAANATKPAQFVYARPAIDNDHAAYVDPPGASWIWEVTTRPPHTPMRPEDDVVSQRAAACAKRYPKPVDRTFCDIASLGHPNRIGEQRYADAAYKAATR